jgi:hypothetical protein
VDFWKIRQLEADIQPRRYCSPNKLPFLICQSQPNLQRFAGCAHSELGVDFQEKHFNGSTDKADKVLCF